MQKRDRIVLWPVYLDSNKTRSEGRRVSRKLAVPAPKLEEIQKVAMSLGFRPEIVSNAAHPSFPWQKTGVIVTSKKGSKTQTIRKIAEKLLESRGRGGN
ncbi:MAG: signal recognition particle subunit SRP19/SEC65 family protein [Candidatus Bathyarchaeia archaeon]